LAPRAAGLAIGAGMAPLVMPHLAGKFLRFVMYINACRRLIIYWAVCEYFRTPFTKS
jgi:hypothetical protein